MTKRTTIVVLGTIGVCMTLLLLSTFGQHAAARPLRQVCNPPCVPTHSCQIMPGGGVQCQFTCVCPPGSTPGTPGGVTPIGTPFVWTPEPTPMPPPPQCQDVCAREDCPEGETRLTRLCLDPVLGTLYVAAYLEGCCGPSCPCGEPTEEEQPCIPGIDTECSEWGATVRASLPVWYADRLPYPRALVTLGEGFWVSDANGNPATSLPVNEVWGDPVDPGGDACDCRDDDSCDDDPPPAGTVCEFRLGLRADPGNEPPTWDCENDGGGIGYRVSCLWNHSSAGKEYLGKGLSCEDLPAFAVHASVPYWWSFARQWEQWEVVGTDCDECGCSGIDLTGSPSWQGCGSPPDGICVGVHDDPQTEWWGRWCTDRYGWNHHGPDWVLLDLRDYGYSMPFMRNPLVQLAPYRDCGPHPAGVLYVPCIEVQGVISNPKEP